jgi:glycosyltransferase involved in cell wall biosynthesis
MSAGCAIISNSFVLAKEMLDEETGIILKGTDVHELAEQAVYLLQNTRVRKEMGNNAWLKTRETTWNAIAGIHTRLFGEITGKTIMPAVSAVPVPN